MPSFTVGSTQPPKTIREIRWHAYTGLMQDQVCETHFTVQGVILNEDCMAIR